MPEKTSCGKTDKIDGGKKKTDTKKGGYSCGDKMDGGKKKRVTKKGGEGTQPQVESTEGGAKRRKKATGAKRPPNAWMKALQQWNKSRGFVKGSDKVKYEIPKKGTTAYNEVRKLMK